MPSTVIVFNEKPTAIITAASSGEAAHASIQLIMKTIGATVLDKCAILVNSPKSKMNKEGNITDIKTAQIIDDLIQNFEAQLNIY